MYLLPKHAKYSPFGSAFAHRDGAERPVLIRVLEALEAVHRDSVYIRFFSL